MFQATTRIRTQMENESVIVIGNLAAHQLHFRLDDLLHVGAQLLGIVVSLAIDDDPMRHSLNFKRERLEITHFNRRVVENVEILRAKRILLPRHWRQSGRDLPRLRREHMESRRRV